MPRTWFLVGCIAYSVWCCSGKGALPKGTNDAAAPVGHEGGASSTDAGSSVYADASAEAQLDAAAVIMRPVSNARSGLAWASGAYNMHDDANRIAFETSRSRLSDVVVVFATRDSWVLLGNTWYLDAHAAFPGKLVITYPMLPDNEGDLASAATGAYDQHWRDIAQAVLNRNRGDSVIRLAWEFNLPGRSVCSSDAVETWKIAWRNARNAMHAVAPDLKFDWNVNAGLSQGGAPASAQDCYPGDDVVDIVGVDSYDWYPRVTDEASWATHVGLVNGLDEMLAFAVAHGKWLSLPEWGVYPGSPDGGDDPLYIEKRYQWYQANAAHIAYEAYFNESAAYYAGSIVPVVGAPNSAARYKELW